ncbi:hypothetical protein RUM43_004912 [Polyplax serrata]|uniref:Uncharacterized protein n=1 Tax=Polyplax serrata TaxID=468196 RepID=A0AAN8XQS4_POLSC
MEETDREDRRASLPRAWPFANPICKPLRLIELVPDQKRNDLINRVQNIYTFPRCPLQVSVAIGFTLLFFLRNCTTEQTGQVPAEMLIWLFLNYGMLLVLTGGDVFTQLLREPTSNVPVRTFRLTSRSHFVPSHQNGS